MNYVVLNKVDTEQKQARYYALTWSPSLIAGGWAIERTWGPLNSQRRQHRTTLVDDQDAAEQTVAQHLRRRLQHGYLARETGGDGAALVAATSQERRKQ